MRVKSDKAVFGLTQFQLSRKNSQWGNSAGTSPHWKLLPCQENTAPLILRYPIAPTSCTVSDAALILTELNHFNQTLERRNHLIACFYALINYKSSNIFSLQFKNIYLLQGLLNMHTKQTRTQNCVTCRTCSKILWHVWLHWCNKALRK